MRSTLVVALCAIAMSVACNQVDIDNRNSQYNGGPFGPTPVRACNDNQDNDGDGKIDRNDFGCWNNGVYDEFDNDERDDPGGVQTPTAPTGTFTRTTPIACTLSRGEYSVFLGWHGLSGATSYTVEVKSSRDGVWRNAQELGGTVANNALTLNRLRTDYDHTFRVYGMVGNTPVLWSTPESESMCRRVPACRNLGDDDGDGLTDMADPGCSNSEDDDEFNAPPPTSTPAPGGGTPTGPGTGTGPGPGGGTPTPTPTPGGSCAPADAAMPASGTYAKGSIRFAVNVGSACSWDFSSNNTHVASVTPHVGTGPRNVDIYFLNSGEASVCFKGGNCRVYRVP